MSSLPVFADAMCRLHADIAIIRLLRAGVPAARISAVFPRRRAPNSVCCWLDRIDGIPRTSSKPIAAAGILGRLFKHGFHSAEVGHRLDELGLPADIARRLLDKTEDGRIVLCMHARTESEAALAWHIFHHVGLESITVPAESVVAPSEMPVFVPPWAVLAA